MSAVSSRDLIIPLVSFNNTEFVRGLSEEFTDAGRDCVVLPKNDYVKEEAERVFPAEVVLETAENHSPSTGLDELLSKYGIRSSRNFVFPDMAYDYDYVSPNYTFYLPNNDIPYDEYVDRLHRWLDKLDSLYSEKGYIPVQNQGGEIFRQCLNRVAKHHGFPVVCRGFSPKAEMCSLHGDDTLSWDAFDDASYDELSSEQREDAEAFVEEITGEREQIGSSSKSLRDRIAQKVQAVRNYRGDLLGPTVGWLRRSAVGDLKAKYFAREYLNERESRKVIKEENFVYFPIQYFRESRVTYRANAYYNQLWLIEYVARSLPHGYKLVVKDHPRRIGELPLPFPRKISRVATAVDHTLNSREIIENADAVVTLNNTVGFESLMFGKSVVAFGSGFYADSEYVHDVDDIDDVAQDLYAAVNSEGLSDEEVLEVASAIVEGSYPGVWGDSSPRNVAQFANSVSEFLDEEPEA